eukprot:4583498-Pyramimonas_sp.AAC.1
MLADVMLHVAANVAFAQGAREKSSRADLPHPSRAACPRRCACTTCRARACSPPTPSTLFGSKGAS